MRQYEGPALLVAEGAGPDATEIDVVVAVAVREPLDGAVGEGEPWSATLESATGSGALSGLAGRALLLRLPDGGEGEVLVDWVGGDTDDSARATGNGAAPL